MSSGAPGSRVQGATSSGAVAGAGGMAVPSPAARATPGSRLAVMAPAVVMASRRMAPRRSGESSAPFDEAFGSGM
ncbi:hypothetical protein [Burkholderia gladioli]|uniref:hypothetical protein n=1 Tax=Burkholderia gladioli TaxID=28095 RepID=UPI001641214E|nr:hypothetical protein [Burkholderia gladioli]